MKKLHLILFFALVSGFDLVAQNSMPITWDQLGDVRFEETYDEGTGAFYDKPIFGPMIQSLDGREVKITGYVIPMDVSLNVYVVSRFPFSSCFFCGNAGAETVVDLRLNDKSLTFKNDDRRTFCGRLTLNSSRFSDLPYILEDVELCP
ncbi:MAG: DUF3299 domain-containing protein [Bacteroidota bacterium]